MLGFWLCCGWWKMKAFTIAAIIAVLAVPANAQMGPGNGGGGGIPLVGGNGGGGKLGKKSDEQMAAEQQQKKNEENAYRDALKKIPNHPVKPADPWGGAR
jgi:hypothetical protein